MAMKYISFCFACIAWVWQLPAQTLWVGTYTNNTGSNGVYSYSFNDTTGELTPLAVNENISNPSFLALSANKQFLYAVNENAEGSVQSFRIQKGGLLQPINSVSSQGMHPCYVSVNSTNQKINVANYSSGNWVQIQVLPDGSLGKPQLNVTHKGSSVNKERQQAPHVHQTIFSPDEKYIVVTDLGVDSLYLHRFEVPKGSSATPWFKVGTTPGGGPRHIVFHPYNPWFYLLEELSGNVTGYMYKDGIAKAFQQVASSKKENAFKGSADIHVSPDGKYLYASNRGEVNSIAVFQIARTGTLQMIQELKTVEAPRNFTIHPNGKWLLVAGMKENAIACYKINKQTGELRLHKTVKNVPSPVCLIWQ